MLLIGAALFRQGRSGASRDRGTRGRSNAYVTHRSGELWPGQERRKPRPRDAVAQQRVCRSPGRRTVARVGAALAATAGRADAATPMSSMEAAYFARVGAAQAATSVWRSRGASFKQDQDQTQSFRR